MSVKTIGKVTDISGSTLIENPESTNSEPKAGYVTVHDFRSLDPLNLGFTLHRNDGGDMPATFEEYVNTLNVAVAVQNKLDADGADQWFCGAKYMCDSYERSADRKTVLIKGYRDEIFTQDKGGIAPLVVVAIAVGVAIIIAGVAIGYQIFQLTPAQVAQIAHDLIEEVGDMGIGLIIVLGVVIFLVLYLTGGSFGVGRKGATLKAGNRVLKPKISRGGAELTT